LNENCNKIRRMRAGENPMTQRSLRGRVAIVGIGETDLLQAQPVAGRGVQARAQGRARGVRRTRASTRARSTASASYSNDRNDPSRLSTALGTKELRSTTMQWGGGGGGNCGAIANGAAAVASGLADCVVAFRALAQGEFGRFGKAPTAPTCAGDMALPGAVRRAVAGAEVRDEGAPLHARERCEAGGAARDRHGLVPPRAEATRAP
jgi:hypothetical protein